MLKLTWVHIVIIGIAFLALFIVLYEKYIIIPANVYLIILVMVFAGALVYLLFLIKARTPLPDADRKRAWTFAKEIYLYQQKMQLTDTGLRHKLGFIGPTDKFYAFLAKELRSERIVSVIVRVSPLEIMDMNFVPTKFNPDILADPFTDFDETFAVTSVPTAEPILKFGIGGWNARKAEPSPTSAANIYLGDYQQSKSDIIEDKLKGKRP